MLDNSMDSMNLYVLWVAPSRLLEFWNQLCWTYIHFHFNFFIGHVPMLLTTPVLCWNKKHIDGQSWRPCQKWIVINFQHFEMFGTKSIYNPYFKKCTAPLSPSISTLPWHICPPQHHRKQWGGPGCRSGQWQLGAVEPQGQGGGYRRVGQPELLMIGTKCEKMEQVLERYGQMGGDRNDWKCCDLKVP